MQPVFNPPLGYLHPDDMTPDARIRHYNAANNLPPATIPIMMGMDVDTVNLAEVWKHPTVKDALGFEYPGIHQLTGSCVWAGGTNAAVTCCALDVIRFGHAERILIPGTLRAYGRSRELLGDTSQGEGSSGATFAKALLEGVPDGKFQGMPQPTIKDGLEYGSSAELTWSSVRNHPSAVIEEGKHHPFKTISQSLRSTDEVWNMIANGYACTFANSYYIGRATMQSDPPVSVGVFDSYGPHQTSIQGIKTHPKLGRLFLYSNQWPKGFYPADASHGLRCGCWTTEDSLAKRFAAKTRYGEWDVECYPLSAYDGYPAQPDIPTLLHWLI